MSSSPIINALIEKRSEIAGAIASLERQIGLRRADLAHLDATLRMFDPTVRVQAIRAKFPAKPRSSLFGNGEISQRCREAIRDAGGEPISAEAIAVRAMTEKGLDLADRALRSDFIRRFLWALSRLLQQGTVRRVGKGMGARWGLPNNT